MCDNVHQQVYFNTNTKYIAWYTIFLRRDIQCLIIEITTRNVTDNES